MPDFKGLDPIIVPQDIPGSPLPYNPPSRPYNIPVGGGPNPGDGEDLMAYHSRMSNTTPDSDQFITGQELKEGDRYAMYNPNVQNREDYAAYGQNWGAKMVNGVGKGLLLTGTTFLQSTAGMLNGLYQWGKTGKASSFYDNAMNKWVDDINKKAEDSLPNYYKDIEKNAAWYSPTKLFSANFLWDGIVKNLGFSAGAALAGLTFAGTLGAVSKGLSSIPSVAKLFSIGKAAEVLAATEEGLATANAAGKAASTYGKLKQLSDSFLGSYKVLDPGSRALVAGLATSGEASFEAYQNLNQFRQDEIQKYRDSHAGMDPTGADLDVINENADKVGNASYLANVALLSVTNYIQFPKILGSSYTAEKGMINGLVKETKDIVKKEGKYIVKPAFGGKILSTINKVRPYTFSISEGFEEGAQYAIQMGTQDYYDKKYNGTAADVLESTLEGIHETLTTNTGMENVLIGGLSGAIMLGRGRYKQGKARNENTTAAIKAFNDYKLSDFTQDTIDSVNRGTALQEEREQSLEKGDILNSKDKEADYINNYLTPRIKYGRFDLVKSDIADHRALASTEEGFAQLQAEGKALETDTREAYLNRLNMLEQTAENTKSLYQSLNIRYGAKIDDKGNLLYTPAVIDKMVYTTTKVADYDQRIPTLSTKLVAAGVNVDEVVNDLIAGKVDSFNEAVDKITKLDIHPEEKDTLGQALDDVAEMSLRRNKFLQEYTQLKNNPKKYQESKPTPIEETPEGEKPKTVKVKTKVGERELEIGTEYYVGRIVEHDVKGKEVYRPNAIIIVKDNGDGTIRIRDIKGHERDIKASVLEDYRLGKVSTAQANPRVNFFMRNWNKIIYWNTGKGKAGKIPGRLEHDPDTDQLVFAYTARNKKGERYVKRIPIERGIEAFQPKEGYLEGLFTFGAELTAADKADMEKQRTQQQTPEQIKIYEINKQEGRREIVNDLYKELKDREERNNKLIEEKKTDIAIIERDLAKLRKKIETAKSPDTKTEKGMRFKPTIRTAIESVTRLLNAKEEIERKIDELETQNRETEATVAYLEDAAQNIEELPINAKELLYELGYQVELAQEAVLEAERQIGIFQELLDGVKKVYDSAVEFLTDLIRKFMNTYPKAPTSLGQEWVDFIHTNPNFLKITERYGLDYKGDLKTLERIVAETEDIDITPNEKIIDALESEISTLKDTLDRTKGELLAKRALLFKFEKAVKNYTDAKIEENRINNDASLIKAALATADKTSVSTTNVNEKENYEPVSKKSTNFLWRSTMGVMRGLAHQVRANNFGFHLESLEDRDGIRGVYVTQKNEDKLIPGLIDHLANTADQTKPFDKTTVIAMVMVREIDGELALIGEDGKPLTEDQLADAVNHAIYQTFPLEDLEWSTEYGKESMFRKGTPQELQDAVREYHKKNREEILSSDDPKTTMHTIGASFGFPDYEVVLDENENPVLGENGKPLINYKVRTAVREAGLITDDDLQGGKSLIEIPKTNTIVSNGTTSYESPYGRPFLRTANGDLPLQNRKHTEKEANNIYMALYHLAKYMVEGRFGEASHLYKWLESVVYWGVPETPEGERKPDAVNSVFWEKDPKTGIFMLTISDKGQKVVFKPSSLEDSKADIIATLLTMHININSSLADKTDKSYDEVISISERGDVITRKWINYQAFLLSNTYISYDPNDEKNGQKISSEDLPLSTVLRSLKDETDVNRTSIYFYTKDNAGDVDESKIVKKTPIIIKPAGNKPIVSKPVDVEQKIKDTIKYQIWKSIESTLSEEPTGEVKTKFTAAELRAGKTVGSTVRTSDKYNLNGEEVNEYVSESGKVIHFKAHDDVNVDNFGTRIEVVGIKGDDLLSVMEDLRKRYSATETAPVEEITEEEVVPEAIVEKPVTSDDVDKEIDDAINDAIDDDSDLREIVAYDVDSFEKEDWKKFEAWVAKNFPNIPIYRLKNIIRATNGRQAWGMLHNAAIYIYENAEIGTGYHEVFEAVWKMFASPEEKIAIENEFRQRKGTFTDRVSKQTVKYSDATSHQIKEELAEEFRAYVKDGKIPAKPEKGRPFIVKLFSDLVNFIKSFFVDKKAQSKIEEMFQNINQGRYKDKLPYESQLSFAKKGVIDIENSPMADDDSEFKLLTGITDKERSEIIEHITYLTLRKFTDNDDNLFKLSDASSPITKKDLYIELKKKLLATIGKKIKILEGFRKEKRFTDEQINNKISSIRELMGSIITQWDQITARHEEYMSKYDIEFDENDELQRRDEDKIKDSDYVSANKVDSFRKMNGVMKLLLAATPRVDSSSRWEKSSIGGVKLIPISETYIKLMNTLSGATNMDDMINRLREMAVKDPTYRGLYKRATKRDWGLSGINFDEIKSQHSARLLSLFWRTFKKNNPEVKVVYILDNGEITVGDANLSTSAAQYREDFISSIISKARKGTSFFKYDEKTKTFVGNPKMIVRENLTDADMVNFLNTLGIQFSLSEVLNLNDKDLQSFRTAVSGIRKSIAGAQKIATFSGRVLSINGQLLELGFIKASIEHPEFDSTFFNLDNERTQSFIGTNPFSDLYDFITSIPAYTKDIVGSQFGYLWTDKFVKGSSVILDRIFTPKGTRKSTTDAKNIMKTAYIGGTDNQAKGRKKESSRLSYKERRIQQLNLALKGYYANLVPGNASMDWAVYMGNIDKSDLDDMTVVNMIFKNYFIAEIEMARENRNVASGRDNKDLRFFKDILDSKLHSEIIHDDRDALEIYKDNETKINNAIKKYIDAKNENLRKELTRYNILKDDEEGLSLENINIPNNLSKEQLTSYLNFFNVNFIINNIELHKMVYGDPYQYKDELKRTKNFNSPRQSIIANSKIMNALFNRVWNNGLVRGDIGWTNFMQDYFRSVTNEDVISVIERFPDYKSFKETDGGGIISFPAYRNFRIRSGDWNDEEEAQYRYDMAWEKQYKINELRKELTALKDVEFNKEVARRGLTIREIDKVALKAGNPKVQSAYVNLKPIVAGNKANGREWNDVVLDKFALYPISFRLLMDINKAGSKEMSNAILLYNKMQDENIDYMVFENSRKVGVQDTHSTYNEDGSFNNSPYSDDNIINVPLSIISIQTEVPAKKGNEAPMGTQTTRLVTMDFMEAGVPTDFILKNADNEIDSNINNRLKIWNGLTPEQKEARSPLYKEIRHNQMLLEAMLDEGFHRLLVQLGISLEDGKYTIKDLTDAGNTLRREIFKREVNDNISDALDGFLAGRSVLEATPAGLQITNILYSIADREVISPNINGGMKVQIPVSLLESVRARRETINGKEGYVSDELGFYTNKDGERVCEIMVKRWFKSKMSDAELIKYLNSPEGQKILSGLAFRIPTQKQNSIDVFRVKQFLPEEFGDSVVIPSAMVPKTGGDFDIDKLVIYLKNIFKNINGDIKLVPYFGIGQQAKDKFGKMYDDGEFLTTEERKQLNDAFARELADKGDVDKLINSIFGQGDFTAEEITQEYVRSIVDIGLRDTVINMKYKESLQNEYIQSCQNLVSNERNFQRLTKPNSVAELKALGKFVAKRIYGEEFNYQKVGNMMDMEFMSRLRHAFVIGMRGIGIAARNQTNHAYNQRQVMYIDKNRLKRVSDEDKHWLKDAEIRFSKYNTLNVDGISVPTMSMIQDANHEYDISDINSQFIDAHVDLTAEGPWIIELGATPNVLSTYLFLVSIGVPLKTVVYFMSQPIIRDYLQSIENAGYSWLFMDNFVEDIKSKYDSKRPVKSTPTVIPSDKALEDLIGMEGESLTEIQKEQQQFILDEFLKYAKMAEHIFHVSQGSNFDTANFNNGYLVFKKFAQLQKAQQTIISSVDDLLANSHVGKQAKMMQQIRDALSTIIKSDHRRVRSVLERVLTPFTDVDERSFIKIAQKAISDLFDYAIQTESGFNSLLRDTLITNGGVAREVIEFVNDVKNDVHHPLHDNHVINIIQGVLSTKADDSNSVNNIKLKALGSKIYDQNNIIYAFRQIREFTKGNNQLYDRIVQLAILQSGLSRSAISFTSLLPFEDFERIYSPILTKIETIGDLDTFADMHVFQRENWNNDDIVPWSKARWIMTKIGWKYNMDMSFFGKTGHIAAGIKNGTIPPMLKIRANTKEANSDYIAYTWEKGEELITDEYKKKYPGLNNYALLKRIKNDMRKIGDYSYLQKGLFEKVRETTGDMKPLETSYIKHTEQGDEIVIQYVYKAINAWGDGHRANEFYKDERPSIIDNGFVKVKGIDNNVIIKLFNEGVKSKPTYNRNNNNAPNGLPATNRSPKKC